VVRGCLKAVMNNYATKSIRVMLCVALVIQDITCGATILCKPHYMKGGTLEL
jgi:hypothetical protein